MSRPHCQKADACAAKGEGHCRSCWAKHMGDILRNDPEAAARQRSGARANMAALNAEWRATPEGRAKRAEIARAAGVLMRPEVRAKAHTPETVAKATATRVARNALMTPEERRKRFNTKASLLAWCPEDLRDDYRTLTKKGIKAAEARQIIERHMAKRSPEAVARRAIAETQAAMIARRDRERAQAY